MAKLNSQIEEQQSRRKTVEAESQRMSVLQDEISSTLYKLLEKLQVRVIKYSKSDKVQKAFGNKYLEIYHFANHR
jgi:hypothetical protein